MPLFDFSSSVTFVVPSNIALVKYWGKRDDGDQNIPANSSLSVSYGPRLSTQTSFIPFNPVAGAPPTVILEDGTVFPNISLLILNDSQSVQPICFMRSSELPRRTRAMIREIQELCPSRPLSGLLVSMNSFPMATGLASSASGAAAIVMALINSLPLTLAPHRVAELARMGSGSAARSVFGGFAAIDCSNSVVVARRLSVRPYADLHIFISVFVFANGEKQIPSGEGMARSARTSPLYEDRITCVAPAHFAEAMSAISSSKDGGTCAWETLARVIMDDSDSLENVCLSSEPSLRYLSESSHVLKEAVRNVNTGHGKLVAAYTFDAGPNGVVLSQSRGVLQEVENELLRLLSSRGLPMPIKTYSQFSADDNGPYEVSIPDIFIEAADHVVVDPDGTLKLDIM